MDFPCFLFLLSHFWLRSSTWWGPCWNLLLPTKAAQRRLCAAVLRAPPSWTLKSFTASPSFTRICWISVVRRVQSCGSWRPFASCVAAVRDTVIKAVPVLLPPLFHAETLQQCCDWLMSQRLLYSHWIVLKMQCRGRRGWILFWSERLGSLCFRQHGRPESASVTVFIVCLHGMFICLFITGGFLGHFCL